MKENNILEIWRELPMEMRPKIRFWIPGAAMDEEDLRKEIKLLAKRGFGGVEVVVLASLQECLARGEDGWGTENWDYMVSVIADETKKLGMSMDLAIGPGWPIASPAIRSIDDPAVLCELTYGVMTMGTGQWYDGPLPERRTARNEGKPKLIHVMAYLEKEEGVLIQESYRNLMPYVNRDVQHFSYDFPDEEGKSWKVFAFYQQPAGQKINSGQNYVIDHLSREGAKACEKYWDGIFAENTYESMESFFCDSLEYEVVLDWTPDLLKEFEERRGYSLLPYLPFIGMPNLYPTCDLPGYRLDNPEISEMANNDYLETVTQCYGENHLAVLETMAEKYGKTIRYQVAYNKPFEAERSALYVAVPENEALGRTAIDVQKSMAAAAHLGRKERYSFECAAEFGHSYGQSYEDLFWWVKRSLMAGMNAQVLHGASYSGRYAGKYSGNGQIPEAQWPGYEGFGKMVSNYWNRTPSVSDARGCLDAVTRLNMIFRKTAKIDCAIFRCSYTNDGAGSEHCLYPDGGLLANLGYSYEFVSESLLRLPVCTVKKGLLDEGGAAYKCLIIPNQNRVSLSFLEKVKELAVQGLPVVWLGEKPAGSLFYAEWDTEEKKNIWHSCLDEVWRMKEISHAICYEEIPEMLRNRGVFPEMELEGSMDLMTAVRVDEGSEMRYFALYGYNRAEFSPEEPNTDELFVSALYRKGTTKGTYERPGAVSRKKVQVKLKGTGDVSLCNPWDGQETRLNFKDNGDGHMEGSVWIEEDEMLVFVMKRQEKNGAVKGSGELQEQRQELAQGVKVVFETLELEAFEPDEEQETSFLRSGFVRTGYIRKLDRLLPWRELDSELEHFSGRGIYCGYIELEQKDDGCRYLLELGEVSDTFTVFIDGQEAEFPDQVMKRVDITALVHEGRNELKMIVVSNLYNCMFQENMTTFGFPIPYKPRNYGIWENEYKKIALWRWK